VRIWPADRAGPATAGRKSLIDFQERWSPRGALQRSWEAVLRVGRAALGGGEDLLIRLDRGIGGNRSRAALSPFNRQSYSAAFGNDSGTTLVPLLPSMMAAILSDVRFATARSGSSFRWA
jgi:hypothetical protein